MKRSSCFHVIGFILFFLPGFRSEAQESGRIFGVIVDRATRSPLAFANVVVLGTTVGTSSKPDGSFVVSRVPSGPQTLKVSMLGYAPLETEIDVKPGATTDVFVELEERLESTPEILVTAVRPFSAASSAHISAMDFELRPRFSAQDLLRLVPGLFIAQHAGGGKAEQIFLRGFDADHGTDVNISVDGIPVNMVTHGHGQGYADLHFVMPEVLRGIEVYKGPYFAQFGDFGTAGTVTFSTLDDPERNSVSVEHGMFGLWRGVGLVRAPIRSERVTAYLAGEALGQNGYFENSQQFQRFNLFSKVNLYFDHERKLTVWGSGFASNWNASGQIPERAVRSGLISRFGSIDPSEGGATSRQNLNIIYHDVGADETFLAQAYVSRYRFRLFSNFTFLKDDPVNGDGIEQTDDRTILGGRAEYALPRTFGNQDIATRVGAVVRHDNISNGLWHSAKRERLGARTLADTRQTNIAFFVQQEYRVARNFRFQVGLRSDLFVFQVTDRLSMGSPADRTAVQSIMSPKANLVYSASPSVDLFLNSGTGFHSNDARALVNSETSLLPRGIGAETGARYSSSRLTTTVALWALDLEREFVFSGDEGTVEESGATRRVGIDVSFRFRMYEWLWVDTDLALARGRYKHADPGMNYIPLSPPLVMSGGLTGRHSSGMEGTLRYRYMSTRPANEDYSIRAPGYLVFDAVFGYTAGSLKLSIVGENIFNTNWNEAQFATESQLPGETLPVSELHFTPGSPLNVRAKVEVSF